jgi:hypothetical protein
MARWQLLLLSFYLFVTVVYCQCTIVCISILWFTSACANSLWKWQLVNSHSAYLKAQSICNSRTFKCPHKNLVLSSHSGSNHHLLVLRFLQYWPLLYKTTMTTRSPNMCSLCLKEHIRYIRKNNPASAYAMHILDNRHEFGPAERTLQLLKHCFKGTKMNIWESLHILAHYKHNLLVSEQQTTDPNPLFDLARIPRDLHSSS